MSLRDVYETYTRRIKNSKKSKYTVIKDYLIERLGGEVFELSDGIRAIMDKSDAKELSHKADALKAAELSNLRKIIKNAILFQQVDNVKHRKFSAFRYYAITVIFNGDSYDILLNVGLSKYDSKYHIYDITKNRGTANQSSTGLSRPVGYAIKNSSSTNSISHSEQKNNPSAKKSLSFMKIHKPATENVSDYAKLNDANKSMICDVIRKGTAMGLSESDAIIRPFGYRYSF